MKKKNINLKESTKIKIRPNTGNKNISSKEFAEERKYNNLKDEYSQLGKINEKNKNKVSELINEINELKVINNNLEKELTISKKSNERIMSEKYNCEKIIKENKSYIIKLESKIFELSKSKSINLFEHNHKITKENENLKQDIINKENQIKGILEENLNLKKEINILNNTISTKLENLKFKGDLKSSLLYNIGVIKLELDDSKELNKEKDKTILTLKKEIDKKNKLLQDITFDKSNIIEELMKQKEENENILKENNKLKEQFSKYINDFEILNQKISSNKKDNNLNKGNNKENTLEKKNEKSDLLLDINSSIKNELNLKYKNICNERDNLKERLVQFENEKKEILEKNRILLQQNNKLSNALSLLSNKCEQYEGDYNQNISDLNNEISNLKIEKENQKKEMSSLKLKINTLESENNSLKEQNNQLIFQFDKIKKTNLLLHKNLSNAIQDSENIINNSDNMNNIDLKLSETNLSDLIKKETEKNKEYAEIIEKYNQNI